MIVFIALHNSSNQVSHTPRASVDNAKMHMAIIMTIFSWKLDIARVTAYTVRTQPAKQAATLQHSDCSDGGSEGMYRAAKSIVAYTPVLEVKRPPTKRERMATL